MSTQNYVPLEAAEAQFSSHLSTTADLSALTVKILTTFLQRLTLSHGAAALEAAVRRES